MKRMLWLLVSVVLFTAAAPAQTANREKVLIRTAKPYTNLVAAITAAGGTVAYQYKYIDAIAAEIPVTELPGIRAMVAPNAISKDIVLAAPAMAEFMRPVSGATPAALSDLTHAGTAYIPDSPSQYAIAHPSAYVINNQLSRVSALHAAGYTGREITVAVIDSGIRPGFSHLESWFNSVIGGEDFVGDGLGFSNTANNGHGTFVAGQIAAHTIFLFDPASPLAQVVAQEAPGAILAGPPSFSHVTIPMLGSAPDAQIYALRVFGPADGAPTSRILAAMDRVIELRELYEQGQPGGLKIKVCNLSLGGATLLAGQDLADQMTVTMLDHDIVPVVAAGNAGPSGLTVGTPGTSYGAITVGAASIAANERVLRRLQFPSLPSGAMYRPFSGTQTAFFSSRGPNANGHSDPDIVASGFANFGQGFFTPDDITFTSGTSVAAPMVTGIAAVLRERFPALTARQVRNAIIATGNPDLLQDDSSALDRGTGYVDALAASLLLSTGLVCDSLYVPRSGGVVTANLHNHGDHDRDHQGWNHGHKLRCIGGGSPEPVKKLHVHNGFVRLKTSDLKPGERFEVLYRVLPNTSRVIVTISDFMAALPSGQQNPLFGDDVFLRVHSAKTSAIGDGDYLVTAFTKGSTYEINNPEEGLMRVTLSGTWTNAGAVSARVSIVSEKDPLPSFTAQGKISQAQTLVFPLNIPAGVAEAEFRLSFHDDWASDPTNDIDMLLVKPDGSLVLDGATLNAPERVIVNNPAPGTWYVLVDGFAVYGSSERFELRVTLDGQLVK